jgi:hypothetical protein
LKICPLSSGGELQEGDKKVKKKKTAMENLNPPSWTLEEKNRIAAFHPMGQDRRLLCTAGLSNVLFISLLISKLFYTKGCIGGGGVGAGHRKFTSSRT